MKFVNVTCFCHSSRYLSNLTRVRQLVTGRASFLTLVFNEVLKLRD